VGTPEHGPDPRHELPRAERLGDVVVGPHLEAEDPIELLGARRQHDDRQVHRRFRGTETSAHLEPVGAGEHQVEHDQRGPLRGHLRECALARIGLTHRVALLLQMKPDELTDVLLVLDHQNGALYRHVMFQR